MSMHFVLSEAYQVTYCVEKDTIAVSSEKFKIESEGLENPLVNCFDDL